MMDGKTLIKRLGGPTKVARDLGLDGKRGVSRVCMWQRRGIPSKVLLEHLEYFFAPRVRDEQPAEKAER